MALETCSNLIKRSAGVSSGASQIFATGNTPARRRSRTFNFGFATGDADVLADDLTVLEYEKHRDGLHAISHRELLVRASSMLSLATPGLPVNRWRVQPARARSVCILVAPFRPEINEDGRGGLEHFGFKILRGQSDGSGEDMVLRIKIIVVKQKLKIPL